MSGWAVGRRAAVLALAAVVAGLILEPARTSAVLWYVLVPMLPAVFLVSPALWRGICPFATLNELGNRLGAPRRPAPTTRAALEVMGLALFYLLVPARHVLLNRNGTASALVIAALGGLAVALGAAFAVRSGFCNALCPILPVELLYGMAPVAPVRRGRCETCTVCTPRGCFDIAGRKTLAQRLGRALRSARWIATPYGTFFAALPGFVIGYYRVADGPLRAAATTYGTIVGWSLASIGVVGALALIFRAPSRRVLTLVAAVSAGLYYWYTGPVAAAQLAAPAWVGTAIRIAGIGAAGGWLGRAWRTHGG